MAKPVLLVVAYFTALLIQGGRSTKINMKNNCRQTVWPIILSGQGSALDSLTGFKLDPSAKLDLSATLGIAGRTNIQIWARTYCSTDCSGKFSCLTGDCGTALACTNRRVAPPATRAEFTLQGDGGKDFYNVSNADGFNLPVSVTPQGGTGCIAVSCSLNLNAWCPPELQLKGPDGSVVGCKSACAVFDSDQYCCSGANDSPSTCMPSKYSQMFKNVCPQACSYANDGATCTFTCMGANYDITFCP